MVANVPRNEKLATMDPGTREAAARWRSYVSEWTTWNHVRMIASAAAAISYVLALA